MATVLVIDDESVILDTATLILEQNGYSVKTETGTDRAFELIENEDPDIVLLDIVLAGRNGLEMAIEINRLKPGLPIILMSGRISTDADSIKNFSGHFGIFGVIAKPFNEAELCSIIKDALNRE